MPKSASVAVIVASRGRPTELTELLAALRLQTVAPRQVILSLTQDADRPEVITRQSEDDILVVIGAPGLCAQRNRGMDAVSADADVIAFLDDDYLPRNDAIEAISDLYTDHPEVVAANGVLLADGIGGPGISLEEARRMIQASKGRLGSSPTLRPMRALYGCNMTFRRAAVANLRFDEKLPLYGWQEDIDFSRRLHTHGKVVRASSIVGVHRGVKGARVSGKKFGYSQVVNPFYLVEKGTMQRGHATRIVAKNLVANMVRAVAPEPWVDRRGRLIGNLIGLADVLFRKADPMTILDL